MKARSVMTAKRWIIPFLILFIQTPAICFAEYIPHENEVLELTDEHLNYQNYIRGLIQSGKVSAYEGESLIQKNREYVDHKIEELKKKPTQLQNILSGMSSIMEQNKANLDGSTCVNRRDPDGSLRMICY